MFHKLQIMILFFSFSFFFCVNRMLEFVIKIGSTDHSATCRLPNQRNEGVIVDFSTDNEITWHLLKVIEPQIGGETTETVTMVLPPDAKTNATIFRWWQPLGLGGIYHFTLQSLPWQQGYRSF